MTLYLLSLLLATTYLARVHGDCLFESTETTDSNCKYRHATVTPGNQNSGDFKLTLVGLAGVSPRLCTWSKGFSFNRSKITWELSPAYSKIFSDEPALLATTAVRWYSKEQTNSTRGTLILFSVGFASDSFLTIVAYNITSLPTGNTPLTRFMTKTEVTRLQPVYVE